MPNANDMRWFKQNFHEKIDAAVQGTPFTLDLMTALACQETGEVWPILRKTDLSLDRILELCVGDTIDFNPTTGKGRKAFPRNKAELVAVTDPSGQEMFDLAHQLLVDMAQFIASYKGAASNPNKFCHGYGIFQFDLQFFKEDPDYFLQKEFANFDKCLEKALGELQSARTKIGLGNKSPLTDLELAHVAIAYNTGHFNPAKGLQQGFQSDDGKFYGEQILAFMQTAKTVSADDATTTQPSTGATGPTFQVTASALNLRSAPAIDPNNVKAKLPNGQKVRAITNQAVNGFLEVETDFEGEHLTGFASAQFLTQA